MNPIELLMPDREELIRRLRNVEADGPTENLFEAIATKLAGELINPQQLADAVISSMTEQLPSTDLFHARQSAYILVDALIPEAGKEEIAKAREVRLAQSWDGNLLHLPEHKQEPPIPDESDITSVEQLSGHLGEVLKATLDGGQSWLFIKIANYGPVLTSEGLAIQTRLQISPERLHMAPRISSSYFTEGLVLRAASLDEYLGVQFSFGPSWDDPPNQ